MKPIVHKGGVSSGLPEVPLQQRDVLGDAWEGPQWRGVGSLPTALGSQIRTKAMGHEAITVGDGSADRSAKPAARPTGSRFSAF